MTRARTPVEQRFAGEGGALCWFEWGVASPQRPSLLLLHATGFHARVWDATVAALPPEQHVVAIDIPGHGRSFRPEHLRDWDATARTLRTCIDAILPDAYVGAGHSMGGHMLLRIAAMAPQRMAHAVLVDPVIMAPEVYDGPHDRFPSAADHPVGRRRNAWASVDEMIERFADRSPYALWQGDVLEDYCRYGLLPAADGPGFELACPPALEVSIYTSAAMNSPLGLLGAVTCPVTVVRAQRAERGSQMDFSSSPTWPALATALPHGDDVDWGDLTHFIPMQAPARLAELINSRIDAAKQG